MWGLVLKLLSWAGLSPVPLMSGLVGTTEQALNLLLSILASYPLAIYYHKFVQQRHPRYRIMYCIITGMDMAFFNFGLSMYHNMIPAVVIYFTTLLLGAGKVNTVITIIFNMGYLLIGYALTESEDYDITWTMPQCVLTLKLIALSFDLWDGQKLIKGEEISDNNKKTALMEAPNFLQLLAFIYFPSSFLVGPIFSFKRFSEFIYSKYPLEENKDVYESQALKRFLQGMIYLTAFQVGVSVFNMQYMQSDEFWESSIFYRHLYCGIWAHFALYKYISCWLLTEASCIRFGISYNGTEKTPEGNTRTKWDGCSNIKLVTFETATKFQHYIVSFNCNTNHFAAEYIYKRLKFLGNRDLSQLLTLMFLAVWHGIRSGYYMTFLNEFMIILMEKDLEPILNKTKLYHAVWNNVILKYILYFVLKMYTIVFMGWSLVPFDVKVFSKWCSIYYSLYFSGFILFAPWPFLYKPLLKKFIKKMNVKNS